MSKTGVVLVLSIVAGVFLACKPGIPKEYLSPESMEDILYDWYIAQGMAVEHRDSDATVYERSLFLSVLNKYHVTQQQFDSSMVYYYRHTELMYDIHSRLAKRMGDVATSMGATDALLANGQGGIGRGDTTDVWPGKKSYVLFPVPLMNTVSFEIKADTSYHKGDRFLLSFDTQFIYQEGTRDAVVCLSVKFANDSVATQSLVVSGSSQYSLSVGDDAELGIKEVKGFIVLNNVQEGDVPTTMLKILAINRLRLTRVHRKKETSNSTKNLPDSASRDTTAGSSGDVPPQEGSMSKHSFGRRGLERVKVDKIE